METAIFILAALVIAVIIYGVSVLIGYAILAILRKPSKIEEQESINWARKWNEQRTKDICDSDCLWCGNEQFCKLKDAQ